MNGKDIQLACQACFAVASALQSIKGISVGVTTFPESAVCMKVLSGNIGRR